jgi:hypothetical protein
MSGEAAGDLADVLRWQDDGGTWLVLRRSPDAVVISLRTCGSDEEMAQLSSRDPALLAYVSQRPNSSTCDAD